jgi:hypothetical protein
LIATVVAVIEFKSIVESIESVTGKDLWGKIKTLVGRKNEDLKEIMKDEQTK